MPTPAGDEQALLAFGIPNRRQETTVRHDYDCPPYDGATPAPAGASILELAARASAVANRFQSAMDAREPYPACVRLAGTLARATQALSTAIADSVACGDNSLS
jgi:hypothetical protein